jgi:hypothetical protein
VSHRVLNDGQYNGDEDPRALKRKAKIARRLTAHLKKQGVTLYRLSILMGCSRSWTRRILDPADTRVSLAMIWRVEHVLRIKLLD